MLIEIWTDLEIGQVSTQILSYVARAPLFEGGDYYEAIVEAQRIAESGLTDKTSKFSDEVTRVAIWGTSFVPVMGARFERSNDLLLTASQPIKSKLLNARSTEEFIRKKSFY